MKELDRRSFLKLSAAATIGTFTGTFTPRLATEVDKSVENATGIRTGNAAAYHRQETHLNDTDSSTRIGNTPMAVKAPIYTLVSIEEEAIFRAAPSALLSHSENGDNLMREVVYGTGHIGLNRREFFVGLITSGLFGIAHNFIDGGVDTKTIPASQASGGLILWYLQRKFGFIANVSAHTLHNLK